MKNTLFVSTPVLTALVKMSVFVFLHFHFCFFATSKFLKDVFDRSSEISRNTKQQKQITTPRKQDAKQKTNLILWFKTKQDTKQKTTITKQHLETRSKQNTNKKQEPETDMINRNEGRKKRTREREREKRERKREKEKGGGQKMLKRNKGRHRTKKCPFLGGKTGLF